MSYTQTISEELTPVRHVTLAERLNRHNTGQVISTRSFKPWRVLFSETFYSRSKAVKREKWLKTGKGREFIKSRISSIASA